MDGFGADPSDPEEGSVDLAVTGFDAPSSGSEGEAIEVTFSVKNVGDAAPSSAAVTSEDTLAQSHPLPSLQGGEAFSESIAVPIAENLTGSFHLAFIVNYDETTNEVDLTNNTSESRAVTFTAPPCSPDPFEQDDFIEESTPLPVGQLQSHNHCEDAHDWFAIDLEASRSYLITMDPTPGVWVEPALTLVDSDGATELLDENSGELEFTPEASGTYYVNATDTYNHTNVLGQDTEYTILVERILPDLQINLTYLPQANAVPGGLLEYDVRALNAGYLEAGPHRMTVYLSNDTAASADDRILATIEVDALGVGSGPRETLFLQLPADLTPGTYSLLTMVDSEQAVEEIDEGNNVSAPEPLTILALVCAVDSYEQDDSQSESSPFALGEVQNRNFCDDQEDWVRFNAEAGDQLLLAVTGFGVTALTEVFDAGGASMAGPASHMDDLRIDYCPKDSAEDGDERSTAKPITVGGSLALNFCDDDTDWFYFTALPVPRTGSPPAIPAAPSPGPTSTSTILRVPEKPATVAPQRLASTGPHRQMAPTTSKQRPRGSGVSILNTLSLFSRGRTAPWMRR